MGDYGTTQTGYETTPVGCRGGNRYVEGCWGFPYLKIKKKFIGFVCFRVWLVVFWCYGVVVSRLYGFMVLWCYGFVD